VRNKNHDADELIIRIWPLTIFAKGTVAVRSISNAVSFLLGVIALLLGAFAVAQLDKFDRVYSWLRHWDLFGL
jgi:hypothetical protein